MAMMLVMVVINLNILWDYLFAPWQTVFCYFHEAQMRKAPILTFFRKRIGGIGPYPSLFGKVRLQDKLL